MYSLSWRSTPRTQRSIAEPATTCSTWLDEGQVSGVRLWVRLTVPKTPPRRSGVCLGIGAYVAVARPMRARW